MIRSCRAVLLLALAAATLHAQLILPDKGETLPTFEVATIKPSRSDLGRSFHISIWWNDNSYRTENLTLREFIRNAYDAASNAQLTGGPDPLLDSRFDISAKIGDEDFAALNKLPREQRERTVRLMMQALLADRFGLKYHVETRELPVFDLVVDKTGSKLQPWVAASPARPPGSEPADPPSQGTTVNIGPEQASIIATGEDLNSLVDTLSHQPELDNRLVVDKTGLTGKYNFALRWQPQRLLADAPGAKPVPSPDATGASLFAALKEQLGLKLESAKGPVQTVVIDAASPPTPN
jgi:uncharacterized protein (TIGR03435 family)